MSASNRENIMSPLDRMPPHRTLRLHEWLLLLALMCLLGGVRAESVYECTDGQGHVAYQQQPCAASQESRVIPLEPARTPQPSPQYAVPRETHAAPGDQRIRAKPEHRGEDAYECRVSDGRVFYRLAGCPRSIATDSAVARRRGHGAGNTVSVSSRHVPRAQACAEMRRAGAIGRGGYEFDERVSTYDRDLGRDPCR
jgi:Domain of unknown function (DUF4124)